MFNKTNRNANDVNEGVDDINNDVSQLADSLEEVLKSLGSDAKEGADGARKKAESLLKGTRNRLSGGTSGRVQQVARDAMGTADSYVREKPWQSVGVGAAVGIFLGALLATRR